MTALVGSEGGWTDEELDAARQAGWAIVTLGGRTLRAETAAIAVAVLLQHLAGDLGLKSSPSRGLPFRNADLSANRRGAQVPCLDPRLRVNLAARFSAVSSNESQ